MECGVETERGWSSERRQLEQAGEELDARKGYAELWFSLIKYYLRPPEHVLHFICDEITGPHRLSENLRAVTTEEDSLHREAS